MSVYEYDSLTKEKKLIAGRNHNSLIKTTTMPTASADLLDKHRLYVGETTEYFTKGGIYECQEVTPATDPATYHWVAIGKEFDDNFIGTLAQWNALSATEKIKYKTADITDDFNGSPVDDALSGTSTNPVQNKVVKAAFDSRDTDLTKRAISQIYNITSGAHTISNVSSGDVFIFVRNANGIIAISDTHTVEYIVALDAVTDVSLNDGVLSFTRTNQYTGEIICLTHNAVTVN